MDVTEALGNCSPDSQADRLQGIQKRGQRVCFIGDGVNDSVALSVADVSVLLVRGSAFAVRASRSGVVLRGANIRKSVIATLEIANLFQGHSTLPLLSVAAYTSYSRDIRSSSDTFRLTIEVSCLCTEPHHSSEAGA